MENVAQTAVPDVAQEKLRLAELENTIRQQNEEIKRLHAERDYLGRSLSALPNTNAAYGGNPEYAEGIGQWIIPRENTLVAHAEVVLDEQLNLEFYPAGNAFDKAVASKLSQKSPITNEANPDFLQPRNENIRDNVAMLRNYLMQVVMAGLDPKERESNALVSKKLEQMGKVIGAALNTEVFKYADMPGEGAAEMYQYLMKKSQDHPILNFFRKLIGKGDYSQWNLPPLELSPFNEANLDFFYEVTHGKITPHLDPLIQDRSMLRPNTPVAMGLQEDVPFAQPATPPQTQPAAPSLNTERMLAVGTALLSSALALNTDMGWNKVEALPPDVQAEAIEHARNILKGMKIKVGNTSSAEWRNRPSEEVLLDANNLAEAAKIYSSAYQAVLETQEGVDKHPALAQGNKALSKLCYLINQSTINTLLKEGRYEEVQKLNAQMDKLPEEARDLSNVNISTLIEQVLNGLNSAAALLQPEVAKSGGGGKPLADLLPPDVLKALTAKRISTAPADTGVLGTLNTEAYRAARDHLAAQEPPTTIQGILDAGAKNPLNRPAGQGTGMDGSRR